MTPAGRALLLAVLTAAPALPAQERPSDEALFDSASDAGARAPRTPLQTPAPDSRDEESLNAPLGSSRNAFETGRVKDNPLQVGGQFYLRGYTQATERTPPSKVQVSLPTLVDGFLDARPTERLRAMVLARMSYDPFLQARPGSFASTAPLPANPSVALDQAWLAFDIEHTLFVTAGRQHVKWGTGHIFNPTDFLSSSRRDPLALFDTRLGVSMVRASLPFESVGANLTGVALFEPTQLAGGLGTAGSSGSTGIAGVAAQSAPTASNTNGAALGSIGGAARAEFALANVAFGVDGLVQRGRKSRAGVDVSAPLGPLDIYGEGLLIQGGDYDRVQRRSPPDPTRTTLGQIFYSTQPNNPGHLTPQLVGGASYTTAFQDDKSVTVGAEYFYNASGYTEASLYPGLILNGLYQPFYTGRNYAAVNATLVNPSAKTSYTVSNIGNLTDGSYISRFDFTVTALSYLTVEAFADYHYGHRGGEFRFAFEPSEAGLPPGSPNRLGIPTLQAPLFDVGFGIRLAM